MNTAQLAATTNPQGRRTRGRSGDVRSHQGQGGHHPGHGTTAQRLVPGKLTGKRLPGQQAGQQADTGAGITQVERRGGCPQAVHADPVDNDPAIIRALDLDTHRAECGHGGQGIVTLQKTAHPGGTLGQGAEHDGSVGDGLIARDPRFAADIATRQ